jgi:Phospholipase A1
LAKRTLILVMLLAATAMPAVRASENNGCAPVSDASQGKDAKQVCIESRLQAHKPSYAVWRQSKGDEDAVQAKYSFSYELRPDAALKNWRVYLKYTGLFDFYMGTRPSSPVVNRLSNPGIHWQHEWHQALGDTAWQTQWFDIGVEHRSNGQTTDMQNLAEADAARRAYERGDHRFFDGISRSANYLSIETKARHAERRFGLYLKTKLYFDSDHAVFWGPQAQKRMDIKDFDRLSVGLTYSSRPESDARQKRANGDSEASLYWTVGDKGPRYSSLDLDYMRIARIDKWDISLPLYVRLHFGPMNNLSNYSYRQTSLGIGLKFSPKW